MRSISLLFVSSLVFTAFANYSNCTFQETDYIGVCEKAVKKGVTYKYANQFLLSFKATQRDFRSLELFSPKKISKHRKSEKKANNTLVKYVPELVAHLKKYEKVYDYAEKKYAVNREIIAAILMKETRLGKIEPAHDAFIVFNTLLTELEPKSPRDKRLYKMAQNNLVAIMDYCFRHKINPNECSFDSSYAGAVGIPQFMPQNFNYIEGYKSKRGDLTKMEDAIVSTSRFLHHNAQLTELVEWNKIPPMDKVETAWYQFDKKTDNASFVFKKSRKSGKEMNCFSCKFDSMEYLRDIAKSIMKYNYSSNYAVGVIRLAYEANRALR